METQRKLIVWYKLFLVFMLVVVIAGPVAGGTLTINKCNVKAGKSPGQDTISFSGQLDATDHDFQMAMGGNVVVEIDADDMQTPLNLTFPINTKSYKNGKYNYARKVNASKMFFKYSIKNGKVNFNAKKVDLTGLACPVTVTVKIGLLYTATDQLDEDIVNGTKKPCPLQLLMGVKNSLTVDKAKVKIGKKPNTDSLSVSGFFTIDGAYNKSNPLIINVGSQIFTVPGIQITQKKTIMEMCKNVPCNEGWGVVSVKFDFSKCKYSISIKKASITGNGTVPFDVDLFDKDLSGFAFIDLPPAYSFWELTQYDQDGWDWTYNTKFTGPAGVYIEVHDGGGGCYEVEEWELGSLAGLWKFCDEIDGAHFESLEISSDLFDVSFDLYLDLLIWPQVLKSNQTHIDSSPFTGALEGYGITIDYDGDASSTTTMGKSFGTVKVPAGTYQAISFKIVLNFDGTLDYYGPVGTMSFTLTETNYAVPGLGIVKRIRKGVIKAKITGYGSIGDSATDIYELAY